MKKLILLIPILFLGACDFSKDDVFQFSDVDRTWAGPEFWANRLQDWKLENGQLVCLNGENPMRTVHLLTRSLSAREEAFTMSVDIQSLDSLGPDASSGFLIGAGQDYRQAALIHHSYGKNGGVYIGLSASGQLFVRDFETENELFAESNLNLEPYDDPIQLSVEVNSSGETIVFVNSNNSQIERLELMIPTDRLIGSIALVSHPDQNTKSGRFAFDNWSIFGKKIDQNNERNGGPIIGSQHTVHDNILKLTAQLMPIGEEDDGKVGLEIKEGDDWILIQEAEVIRYGFTANFRIENWDDTMDQEYRLSFFLKEGGEDQAFYKYGTIRKNPVDKKELVVAAFTGNHNNVRPNPNRWGGVNSGKFPWDWGLWFPHNDLIENLKWHEPDVLFFSGDQVYEGASPTWADRANGHLDYLYKWYLWCWAFGDLTAEIPTISIPDDHDVYHGNIWGAGGRKAEPGPYGGTAQDGGGYRMPAEWVNMVERTQTSHLPDPFDPGSVEQGIGTYFTDLSYGGVSFAILEDRKFKSPPKTFLPKANVVNGWALNRNFNAKTESDAKGAILLGDRQLHFLENWARDWDQDTQMKAVLSQTIFADVVTLPSTEINDSNFPRLEIYEKGAYAPDDVPAADMDSNGWPKTGRDKAVRTIRKAFAVHIAGDQHLGSTIQYGVEEYNDSGFALCVPSIANFYPRRWFPKEPGKNRKPGAPKNTGEFEDGFGNKMTVHAVSNPYISGIEPAELHDKAAGYGIVRFNKSNREITMENWPRWANPNDGHGPYDGWPVRFNQMDNYGKKAAGYLPKLTVSGIDDPVVQVYDETDNGLVYTVRIKGNSFRPKVFRTSHSYGISVGAYSGDPKTQTFTGVMVDANGELTVNYQ